VRLCGYVEALNVLDQMQAQEEIRRKLIEIPKYP